MTWATTMFKGQAMKQRRSPRRYFSKSELHAFERLQGMIDAAYNEKTVVCLNYEIALALLELLEKEVEL